MEITRQDDLNFLLTKKYTGKKIKAEIAEAQISKGTPNAFTEKQNDNLNQKSSIIKILLEEGKASINKKKRV